MKGLKPLTILEVAEKVKVSPTVVSCVVRDKYALTPKGTIELRQFFTQNNEIVHTKLAPELRAKIRRLAMFKEEVQMSKTSTIDEKTQQASEFEKLRISLMIDSAKVALQSFLWKRTIH